jgi:two-component system capsular synthesis response regulator RcsB
MKIRIVAVDDHPVLLAGVEEIIAEHTDLELVAAVRDSTQLVDVLSSRPAEVVVADFSMPQGRYGDGVALLRFLQRRFPQIRLVVLTGMESALVLQSIVAAGVQCVVGKSDPGPHLVPAIRAALRGEAYLAPSVLQLLDEARAATGTQATSSPQAGLSRRESEVIRMYAEGLSVQDIAGRVGRSPKTISTQKVAAMRKLGVANDAELFTYALANGLVSASQAARGALPEIESSTDRSIQAVSDGSHGHSH